MLWPCWPHSPCRSVRFLMRLVFPTLLTLMASVTACHADSPGQERMRLSGHRMFAMNDHGMDMLERQEPVDVTNLSLEELLNLEITPVNVLGAHTHHKGEIMFGYHYMNMNMVGNLNGTRRVSDAEILAAYPVSHTDMHMDMHMFELMYAPSDRSTLMLMIPYKLTSMNHLTRTGTQYLTTSEGFGDLELLGNYTVLGNAAKGGHRLLVNAGVSFPTGGINFRHRTPTSPSAKLEYMMQLGSGTFDVKPGLTYLGEQNNWAWGAQALGTIRTGKNDNQYALGDALRLSLWTYYKVTDSFSPSLRLEYNHWGNVRGADPELNPATNPAFDATLQRGSRLDLFFGFNLYTPRGRFKGNRFSLEMGTPIYQSLAGPNPRTDFQWTLSWSYTY